MTSPPPDLLNGVQTYCMVPLLPSTCEKLHASVNGVWGGVGSCDPILTSHEIAPEVTRAYSDDASFVGACHKAGIYVCGMIPGIEGDLGLREKWPNLDDMACRDAQGHTISIGKGQTLMCVNNPAWQQWELDYGERSIDAGADVIELDTPMSAAFVSGILKGGFCKYCMANFQAYLKSHFTPDQLRDRFGVTDLSPAALIPRLSPLQDLANPKMRPFWNTTPDDLLFREFIRCQEQASFDTRKTLADGLRAYAKTKGRQVVLATNAANLGTVNPGGFWIRGIMFADLFDQFIYEQDVAPDGMPDHEEMPYPRGKWAPYHKLAYAIHHRRAPAVISAGNMGKILMDVLKGGKTVNAWMEVQSAEAYASNGAYVQYHVAPSVLGGKLLDACWRDSAEQGAFVMSHRDLYDGDLRSGSSLALLFLYNERGRAVLGVYPSYLGFATALTEVSVPYDVVFGGDGHYVRDRLVAADVQPYRTLIVPSPISPTDNQKRLVQEFVRGGGTVVCEEPDLLGLSGAPLQEGTAPPSIARRFAYGKGRVWVLAGEVTNTATGDLGANFFATYAPALRTAILGLVGELNYVSVAPAQTDGLVTVFPIAQPERNRLVAHLANCDIDYAADKIREKTDVELRLWAPSFVRGQVSASLITPDAEPVSLPVKAGGDAVTLTVPRLGAYATVVVAGAR